MITEQGVCYFCGTSISAAFAVCEACEASPEEAP